MRSPICTSFSRHLQWINFRRAPPRAGRHRVAEFANMSNARSGRRRRLYRLHRAPKDRIVDHHSSSASKHGCDLEPDSSKLTTSRPYHPTSPLAVVLRSPKSASRISVLLHSLKATEDIRKVRCKASAAFAFRLFASPRTVRVAAATGHGESAPRTARSVSGARLRLSVNR